MAEQRSFVVRPLPGAALEGAFRVHISPDALEKLGLKVGDICKITSDDTAAAGYGIAWRATDKMGNSPRLRPAKMSDTLRSAFNFAEGSQVTIEATKTPIYHADKVTLSDVTPVGTNGIVPTAADADDKSWLYRCAFLLVNCEAVTPGITFDLDGRRKGLKKRFFVDRIESKNAKSGDAALYRCDDDTRIVFNDGSATPTQVRPNEDLTPCVDTTRIGGLVDQVKKLNKRLDRILSRSQNVSDQPACNQHILLYGYEGTGKSMLLDLIDQGVAARTFRLDGTRLAGGVPSKNIATIQQTFREALANQPSVILMDDLDELVPADDKVYSRVLQAEINTLKNSNVLVIAAARNPSDIEVRLRRAGRFLTKIELPIPDLNARKEILNVLQNKRADFNDPLSAAVSLKTHAFTPSDLADLTELASTYAMDRHDEMHGEWISIQARASMLETSSPSYIDGSVHSQATTEVEHALSRLQLATGQIGANGPELLLEDFELALKEVKPTALREIFLETPKITWADIGGSEVIKQRFDEVIGWPFYYADRLEEANIRPQRGVLLYGPPGCSKTLTAQAVANTYDLNFIAVKGAELISMYVGESERAVRDVFRKARQAAPCVIFFDEIDSIGAERDNSGTKGLNVLTTLLNEMDGFEEMKGVMVLAATNKPETLDPALLRPGRFDSHVYLGPPNASARRAIVDIAMKQLPVTDNVRYNLVAATEGYSGAELVHICEMAKMNVIRRSIETGAESRPEEQDFALALKQTNRGITQDMLAAYDAFANRGL